MEKEKENKDCFVIMPISDVDGYESGHFDRVYQDIIKPALLETGFSPRRADEEKQANLIQLDILNKLIEAPIAICDLSTRNPNVMFELGIRQAFDKPVVLIQEKGTQKIFDISPLRYLEYPKEMRYHEVICVQKELREMVLATAKAPKDDVNSIVRLLSIGRPAAVPKMDDAKRETLAFEMLSAQVREIKEMMDSVLITQRPQIRPSDLEADFRSLEIQYHRTRESVIRGLLSEPEAKERYQSILRRVEQSASGCVDDALRRRYQFLAHRVLSQLSSDDRPIGNG